MPLLVEALYARHRGVGHNAAAMTNAALWREDGPGRVTIEQGAIGPARLVPDEKRMILLALFRESDKAESLDFARQVAGLLGLDVQDRRVEHGEVTAGGVVVERLGPDEAD